MNYGFAMPSVATVRGTLAAAALATASACSWALPSFTIDPAAAGLNGQSVIGDNLILSDFSTTLFTSATTFSEQGYLAIRTIELEGDVAEAYGPASGYGLYIGFNATGTFTGPGSGTFDTLSYTLYGYNGAQARFGFSGTTTMVSKPGVALATGTLTSGTVSTSNGAPRANAIVTFTPTALGSAFFASPAPFHPSAETSFTNTVSQVSDITGGVPGFRIRQGGGSFNFAIPVPEPGTCAMLLAGLAAVGFVARRRRH